MAVRRRQCAAMQEYERLLEESPSFRNGQRRAEEFTSRAITSGEADKTARKLITIPTVVHVVYKKPEENISLAQIKSQITAMNKDFRATNPDTSKVPAPWKGLVADTKVKFALATTDPDGKKTDGVVRVETHRAGFGAGDDVKRASRGGSTAWPSDAYLNLWVCTLKGGLLGYAQFPGGPKATDGVVILNTAFGTVGHGGSAVQPGPDRDPRGRALAQPAPHLGRHPGLQRRRPRSRHTELRGTQHRQAEVPQGQLQQRAERRHVRELHGLHRRRGDVHVHRRAGHADERLPRGSAQVVRRVVAGE